MGFFRRKKPAATPQPVDSAPMSPLVSGSEIDDDGATPGAPTPASPTPAAGDLTPEDRADELDKLADEAQGRGEIDQAIAYYEESLAVMERFGPAYNGLLTLYNTKLSESAHAKDNAAIEGWTRKLDQLMDLSKRIMRSKY
ncbi:MAG: hypothetical protein QM705_13375 [Ancrocorticia sp.]